MNIFFFRDRATTESYTLSLCGAEGGGGGEGEGERERE